MSKTDKKIKILRIEKEKGKGNKTYLPGDNIKYLHHMDLSSYNIIDLDAYGIPYEQMEILFKKNYNGFVVVTCIQSMYGNLPTVLLKSIGYTKEMIRKCRCLSTSNGIDKTLNYLANNGVSEVRGYFDNRYNYFYFHTQKPSEQWQQSFTNLREKQGSTAS
jgi:hypothetical protein